MYGWEAIEQGQGLTLMVVGVSVVFTALLLLILMMKGLRFVQEYLHHRSQMSLSESADGIEPWKEGDIPGVVVAAIALTIILEEEQIHDEESMVLTLHALPKPYNNWIMSDMSRNWMGMRRQQTQQVRETLDP